MKKVADILLIDDDSGSREPLALLLGNIGHQVTSVATGREALSLLSRSRFDIVITDLFLPNMSGIDILKHIKSTSLHISVIVVTGNATAESAVEAMKEGAYDYITKPINFEQLKIQIAKAMEKSSLVAENIYLKQQLRGRYRFENIVGSSKSMRNVFTRMEKIIETDSTILILGESGTGKELVAKAIHYNSHRRNAPFIAINCGAIPAELLESELFGHVKGSFTGAITDKIGKFEQANGGTIFLDEIGDMPQHLQMKLLRVLQEHEVERIGSNRRIKLNVRVVSATNLDLGLAVEENRFREDLYYRLNVIPIILPPLRERFEDIELLARHFLLKTAKELKKGDIAITNEAVAALEKYRWPGNVREMENIIERTVALADTELISLDDLPTFIAGHAKQVETGGEGLPRLTHEGCNLPHLVEEIEKQMIEDALRLSGGVKARAAKLLGLNRTTLVEKIKRLNIEQETISHGL